MLPDDKGNITVGMYAAYYGDVSRKLLRDVNNQTLRRYKYINHTKCSTLINHNSTSSTIHSLVKL